MNLTEKFFRQLSKLVYFFGVSNMWFEDVGLSDSITILYRRITKAVSVCLYLFVGLELIAIFTQSNLTEKQRNDRLVFGFSHPVLMIYYTSIEYYKEIIKEVLYTLAISLKNTYNNKNIEKQMIRKSKFYSAAYLCSVSSALVSYGFDGLVQVLRGEGTFTTVMTAWPEVHEESTYADVARVISYILWWLFMMRVSAVYVLVISLTICLSHQYKNLQSYFYDLNEIFNENNLSQTQKEMEYERSVKVGIKLHSDTLWCTGQSQAACAVVFSGQILINICVICLLMLQMVNSERTLMSALAFVTTGIAMLISTGFFMWNAGDVTVEAGCLSTAMYNSGWENCQGVASTRIRRLLVIAMAQSQRPVVLRSFNIIELSYQSYLSIVKSSYSVFSILY